MKKGTGLSQWNTDDGSGTLPCRMGSKMGGSDNRCVALCRELRCLDQALKSHQHWRNLATLTRVHTLSIDAHNDISHDGDRFAYRNFFKALPPSIIRLEVIHAHGPDVKVISAVKRYCPKLEELRLGRCTMFNRSPACEFWQRFFLEHDSYLSIEGTEEYAVRFDLAYILRLGTNLSNFPLF